MDPDAMAWKNHIPRDIAELYEVHDSHHAAAVLTKEFPEEFKDLCSALRNFRITENDLCQAGGSESAIPKKFSNILRPLGWSERKLMAELVVDGETVSQDTHKVDYVKGRVAVDMEWNSKDQTFDRDLYAFSQFFRYDRLSVGVIITRSAELNDIFRRLNIMPKYGASTTWMGKLLPRLHAGRSMGCPILALGIRSALVISGSGETL